MVLRIFLEKEIEIKKNTFLCEGHSNLQNLTHRQHNHIGCFPISDRFCASKEMCHPSEIIYHYQNDIKTF